jgi:hypothetical protein
MWTCHKSESYAVTQWDWRSLLVETLGEIKCEPLQINANTIIHYSNWKLNPEDSVSFDIIGDKLNERVWNLHIQIGPTWCLFEENVKKKKC